MEAIESLVHPDGSASEGPGLHEGVDPTTTGVVVVDVQRMFTDLLGVPVAPPLEQVLPAMTRFLDAAREAGATVILVRTILGPEDHSRNTIAWPDFMRANLAPGAPGTEFDPAIVRRPGDVEVVKQRYSAFVGTPLDSILRERGLTTVIIFGITTNVCVQSTARDAWQLDYETITLADCSSEIGEGEHERSLAYSARNFGRVCTSDDLIAAWQTTATTA